MKVFTLAAIIGLALLASPMLAQDDDGGGGGGEIIVTAMKRPSGGASGPITSLPYLDRRPVIGLRRPADGVVRHIDIVSDSRDEDMRKAEVLAMLLAALDRARREGLSLVTGELEVTEVTPANWRILFPALADKAASDVDEAEDDDSDDDENGRVKPGFEDDGSNATVRLLVKTKLTGTIADAQGKITAFVKAVPATGRSLITQRGPLALTIINPEQYRDEIYRRIAKAGLHAAEFYGANYGVEITGLNREIAWAQVSNTEVFLYIPYAFVVRK